MVEGGKALQRAGKAFERNFGAGTATPENMAKAAADMGTVIALMLASAFSINAEPRESA